MSENTDKNENSSKEIENANKYCPKCNKSFNNEPDLAYCYFDGTKLVTGNISPDTETTRTETIPLQSEFSGFELNLQNPNLNIPLDIIQTTTRLIQVNQRMPDSAENVKTSYWTINSPKPKRNFITKRIKHVGFSKPNIMAYLVCLIFIAITYSLWIYRALPNFTLQSIQNDPQALGTILIVNVMVLIVLIFPVISLGYTATDVVQATKKDYFLKLEPTLFILTIVLNYVIYSFGGPLPILIIPGEPKIRGLPTIESIVKAVKRGIYPTLLLVLGFFTLSMAVELKYVITTEFIQKNIQILTMFGLAVLVLELMPFGNAIGKILLKHDPLSYYLGFSLTMILLFASLSMYG